MAEMLVETPQEVVKFLKAQHDLINDMFDDVLQASDPTAREIAFHDLRQLLALHETAEELIIHPRVRREAAFGDEIADAQTTRRALKSSTSPRRSSSTSSPTCGRRW